MSQDVAVATRPPRAGQGMGQAWGTHGCFTSIFCPNSTASPVSAFFCENSMLNFFDDTTFDCQIDNRSKTRLSAAPEKLVSKLLDQSYAAELNP